MVTLFVAPLVILQSKATFILIKTEGKRMKNFFLYLAVGGIFYTAFTSSLQDMTKADCLAGVQAACTEVAKW